MHTTRTIVAASLTAIALLAGCGSSSDTPSAPSTTGTTLPPSTTTTKSVASLKTALLTPADVPGSTGSDPTPGNDTDLSACFPGNPLGVKTDPNEVSGPDLSLSDPSGAQQQFSSSARQASAKQATDYVNTFASPSGSACALNGFKASLSNDPKGPKIDGSGLSGTATTAAVGDGGTVLALTGNITVDGNTVPASIDVVVFHKGPVVVLVFAGTFAGPPTPGLGVELANKVAGRLT